MDSKQVIELLAGKMGISCQGKDGCSVVCVLKWEDVQAISTVIQQQDDRLSAAKEENERITLALKIAADRFASRLDYCPSDLDHECDRWQECNDSKEEKSL